MLRWSVPLVLVACTSFAEPEELALVEPAAPPPPPVQRIPDDATPEDEPVAAAAPVERAPLVRAPAEGIPADARIELQRGPCYGRCPVYSVVLTADGVVRWHGEHFVEQRGDAEAMITTGAFAKLWRRMNEEEFAELPDNWPKYPSPFCETYATDHSSAIVMLSATDVAARVVDYHGCYGNARVEAFRKLEDRIDEVAGSKRWIGRCRTERCEP
jgi:hypothetical protein